jgi:predicted transcriptional regulator of viral defense system
MEDLKEDGLIIKSERDKYQISNKTVGDFEMANYLYEPLYLSLETALNYWGVLSQFPFEITSVTIKKSVNKKLNDQIFSYSH